MPRSIENIVENHRVASKRRAAGKPIWDRRIDIKGLLGQDPSNISDEHAAKVANQIAALIRSSVPASWLEACEEQDSALAEIVEGMEALAPDSYDDDEDFSPLEDLNNMLDQLYDWADAKRVWLG